VTRKSKRELERELEALERSGDLGDADLFRVYFGMIDGDVTPAKYGLTRMEVRREMRERYPGMAEGRA